MKLIIPLVALALLGSGIQAAATPQATKSAPPTFKDIQPIFKANCVGCHSGDGAADGLDLSSYATLMEGGEDGLVVKKGSAKESKLIKAVRGIKGTRKMPPGKDKLAEPMVVKLESWITAGAKP